MAQQRRPIYLVGPMGAGKSTIGQALADRLGISFRDSDRHIESMTGQSIPQLFEKLGEAGFRDHEETALESLTLQPDVVLATGGGAILRRANRQRLNDRGIVVYLSASVASQLKRTRGSDRPLLKTGDPEERLRTLLAERDPLYRTTAHHVIDTDGQTPEAVIETLLAASGSETIGQPG
jgi:shikimate kinase